MKTHLSIGLATVLLAGLMSSGDAHAGWPQPGTACTQANAGTTETVVYGPRRGEYLEITYYCDGSGWQLFVVCDLNPGGICILY